MKNYNEIVSIAREIARDGLRLSLVNSIRTDILHLENTIKTIDGGSINSHKDIARAEFAKTQVSPKDPDAESKLKALDDKIDSANKNIAENLKTIEIYRKEVDELNEKINKVQAGEIKVSMEELEANANALLKEITKAVAVEKAV